jgi:transposase
VHACRVEKDAAMPSRYDGETKVKAVRLVKDHVADYETEWAAITAISARLDMNAETLPSHKL